MYLTLQNQLAERVRALLHEKYQLDIQNIVIAQPPDIAMGEYALPLAMELAKKLRKPPRKIAEEIIAALGELPGFEKFEIAGAGYINARVKRADFAAQLLKSPPQRHRDTEKVLVEHTSINPNKAAHVGHLRNAILGDSFVRLLRAHGVDTASVRVSATLHTARFVCTTDADFLLMD